MKTVDGLKYEQEEINKRLRLINVDIEALTETRAELEEARLQKMSEINMALQAELEELEELRSQEK